MKHDYNKKTNWKLDAAFYEAWPEEKRPQKRHFSVRNIVGAGVVVLAIISLILIVKHPHQESVKPVTENTMVQIPLKISGS